MDPFLGEIKLLPWNWAPRGWALCNGQILSIAQNTALFSLLGTTYGGNGQTTFALPNLQSRVPMHRSANGNYVQGEMTGEENVTINLGSMPLHNHALLGTTTAGDKKTPNLTLAASSTPADFYYSTAANLALNPASIGPSGGGQPHANMQPYLVINYVIATSGAYPSRN